MPKIFIFDTHSVSFKKYKIFTVKRILYFLIAQILISFLLLFLLSRVYTTPREKELIEQNSKKQQYISSLIQDKYAQKRELLAHIPSIQPIYNKDLKYTSSGWGYRVNPINKTKEFHYGQDFVIGLNSKVIATANGRVFSIQRDTTGYGNNIIIDHGYGYKSSYSHLSKIIVKLDQKVDRGDIIGLSGNTGASTGPHLHYEVFKDDIKVNPIDYFFKDLTDEQYKKMIEISTNTKSLD